MAGPSEASWTAAPGGVPEAGEADKLQHSLVQGWHGSQEWGMQGLGTLGARGRGGHR